MKGLAIVAAATAFVSAALLAASAGLDGWTVGALIGVGLVLLGLLRVLLFD